MAVPDLLEAALASLHAWGRCTTYVHPSWLWHRSCSGCSWGRVPLNSMKPQQADKKMHNRSGVASIPRPCLKRSARAPTSEAIRGTVATKSIFDNRRPSVAIYEPFVPLMCPLFPFLFKCWLGAWVVRFPGVPKKIGSRRMCSISPWNHLAQDAPVWSLVLQVARFDAIAVRGSNREPQTVSTFKSSLLQFCVAW